jgi:hypothetical protein
MEGESARVSRASECELDLKTTDEPQSSSARVASIDAPVDATHYILAPFASKFGLHREFVGVCGEV